MSYRAGPHLAQFARDFRGRKVRVVRELRNKAGDVFKVGTVMEVSQVFNGHFNLWQLFKRPRSDGVHGRAIHRVDPWAVELLPT